MPTKEGHISVPGGKIWYQVHENNRGKYKTPIIILHGGPGIPHNYLLNLRALSKHRTIVFYDQLGCGNSLIETGHKELWVLSRFVTELDALTNALKVDRFCLFLHFNISQKGRIPYSGQSCFKRTTMD